MLLNVLYSSIIITFLFVQRAQIRLKNNTIQYAFSVWKFEKMPDKILKVLWILG